MSLYKYFAVKDKLPRPTGPLSLSLSSSAIVAANGEVTKVLDTVEKEKTEEKTTKNCKRGEYAKYSPAVKIELAKYAAQHGIMATLRHYAPKHPGLKESTVRTWRDSYTAKLNLRVKRKEDKIDIEELPTKKRGCPFLLGEDLDRQVQAYLTYLRSTGSPVNTAITLGVAEGIVKNEDSNLLATNGGHIVLTKYWAKGLLTRMGFVKRRSTTTAKVNVSNFDEVRWQFLVDVKTIADMEEIPFSLIINWDQTAINYIPLSSWTMEKRGSKRVEIIALDDKRQITTVFAGTLTGDFLPPQVIYQGTTQRCLPNVEFPKDWHVTCTSNHWSNEGTMMQYIDKILLPYIKRKREELQLKYNYPALVIFDNFIGQNTEQVLKYLQKQFYPFYPSSSKLYG